MRIGAAERYHTLHPRTEQISPMSEAAKPLPGGGLTGVIRRFWVMLHGPRQRSVFFALQRALEEHDSFGV